MDSLILGADPTIESSQIKRALTAERHLGLLDHLPVTAQGRAHGQTMGVETKKMNRGG